MGDLTASRKIPLAKRREAAAISLLSAHDEDVSPVVKDAFRAIRAEVQAATTEAELTSLAERLRGLLDRM